MDIARLSMEINGAKLSQEFGMAVLKMAIDTAEDQGVAMAKLMEESTPPIKIPASPDLGNNIDIIA